MKITPQKYKIEDMVGMKINHLTIKEEVDKQNVNGKNRRMIECLCDCGNIKIYPLIQVMTNQMKTCGCRRSLFSGDKNNYLEILEYVENNKSAHGYKVKCNNCNSIHEYDTTTFNNKKHCGCLTKKVINDIVPLELPKIKGVYTIIKEIYNERKNKGIYRKVIGKCKLCGEQSELNYGKISNGKNGCSKCAMTNAALKKQIYPKEIINKLHNKLGQMIFRCYNTKSKDYSNYGGRGIKVCDEWRGKGSHKKFREWSMNNGFELDLEIDRKDNDGDYTPENCRYVTRLDNQRNTRQNVLDEQLVREIKYGKYKDLTNKEISDLIDVRSGTIGFMRKGGSWIDI